MSTKTLNTRIQAKIDISTRWDEIPNFVPLAGEICVYSDINKIKIGNGTTKLSNLSFINTADDHTDIASVNPLQNKVITALIDSLNAEISTKIEDAPNDYGTYARKNGQWAEIDTAEIFVSPDSINFVDPNTTVPFQIGADGKGVYFIV